jgi:hypothetical protein
MIALRPARSSAASSALPWDCWVEQIRYRDHLAASCSRFWLCSLGRVSWCSSSEMHCGHWPLHDVQDFLWMAGTAAWALPVSNVFLRTPSWLARGCALQLSRRPLILSHISISLLFVLFARKTHDITHFGLSCFLLSRVRTFYFLFHTAMLERMRSLSGFLPCINRITSKK